MERFLILGEEHYKATAHNAIHDMLSNNSACLFLTEKRGDILALRQALAKDERQQERQFLNVSPGNKALQAIFNDSNIIHSNIHSVHFDGTNALLILDLLIDEDTNDVIEDSFSTFINSENINMTLTQLLKKDKHEDEPYEEYKILTQENEEKISFFFSVNLSIRELRNKYMAQNIIKFVKENPNKDIVVLCGAMHLCRTNMAIDRPSDSLLPLDKTRKSLLDFILDDTDLDDIDKKKIEIYIEDQPEHYTNQLFLDMINQISAIHPQISINKFSNGLPNFMSGSPSEKIVSNAQIIANLTPERYRKQGTSSSDSDSSNDGVIETNTFRNTDN